MALSGPGAVMGRDRPEPQGATGPGADDAVDAEAVALLEPPDGGLGARAEAPVDPGRAEVEVLSPQRELDPPDADAGRGLHADAPRERGGRVAAGRLGGRRPRDQDCAQRERDDRRDRDEPGTDDGGVGGHCLLLLRFPLKRRGAERAARGVGS
jgi:hypothetical protein